MRFHKLNLSGNDSRATERLNLADQIVRYYGRVMVAACRR
jgi:hypothetical protein